MIQSVAECSFDLNFDGLMIEVHPNPSAALSDKEQQLTPPAFFEILDELIVRQPRTDDVVFLSLLEELRDRIDKIDEDILVLMAERMRVAREIGQYKKEKHDYSAGGTLEGNSSDTFAVRTNQRTWQ